MGSRLSLLSLLPFSVLRVSSFPFSLPPSFLFELPGRSFHSFTTTVPLFLNPLLSIHYGRVSPSTSPRSRPFPPPLIDSTRVLRFPPLSTLLLSTQTGSVDTGGYQLPFYLSCIGQPFYFTYTFLSQLPPGRLCDAPLPPNHPRF
jgi:hypothetical protein